MCVEWKRVFASIALMLFAAGWGHAADMILLDATEGSGAKWLDQFDGGVSAGASMSTNGEAWILAGSNSKDVWGRVYQRLDIDLDRYRDLHIDVSSVTREGYVLVTSDKLEGGYKRLADIKQPGVVIINLPERLGLKGKQSIQLELGVVDDSAKDNLKARMTLKGIRVTDAAPAQAEPAAGAKPAAARRPKSSALFSSADNNSAVFQDAWGAASTGATVKALENGNAVVTGTNKSDVWGCVYMEIPIGFNNEPELVVHVENVTGEGYLIMKHPEIKDGYARLNPPPAKKNVYRYALKDYLKGQKTVELQFGVVNSKGPTAAGAVMEISKVELVELADAEAEAGAGEIEDVQVDLFSADRAAEHAAEFLDRWGDNMAGAAASVRDGKLVVSGVRENDIWGCVYRAVEIPLDQSPVLTVDVAGVKGEGYIILKGDGVPDGYVKLKPAPAKAGLLRYQLTQFIPGSKTLLLELQIGVVNNGAKNAVGAEVSISSMRLDLKKKRN